ncbi:CobD/CbiB family cobalamin biosynthesis protein, partial [Streptomyces diacarni]|uniref:CobD/CbiB family cobalamin biosynthesis protein n=1 Tax=Streptomyces diacarni TaxID=2800381 RepID=UPI0033F645B5
AGAPAKRGTGRPAWRRAGTHAGFGADTPGKPGTGAPARRGTAAPAEPGTGTLAKPGAGAPAWPGTGTPAKAGTGTPAWRRAGALAGPGAGGGSRAARGATVWAVVVTAAATWSVLGGTSLTREARAVAAALEAGDLELARERLPALCGRDPQGLDAQGVARAVVESVAENTSDAVVGALVWGALAGVPGMLGFRAVNTLDAMVGHRSPRHRRFGWAAARLDDAAGWPGARLTAVLAAVAGSDPRGALRAWRSDARRHPSPNAGPVEASFAGALGVRLGGTLSYGGRVEHRPVLNGPGAQVRTADIERAVRLSRRVGVLALAVCCAVGAGRGAFGAGRGAVSGTTRRPRGARSAGGAR